MLDGLQFDNQALLHKEVNTIATVKLYGLIDDGQSNLAMEDQPSLAQFIAQTRLVSRLEQPWPQATVNLNRSSDNLLGQRITLLGRWC